VTVPNHDFCIFLRKTASQSSYGLWSQSHFGEKKQNGPARLQSILHSRKVDLCLTRAGDPPEEANSKFFGSYAGSQFIGGDSLLIGELRSFTSNFFSSRKLIVVGDPIHLFSIFEN